MRMLLSLIGLSAVLTAQATAQSLEQQLQSNLPSDTAGWALQESGKGATPQPYAYGSWRRGTDEHMFILLAHPSLGKEAAEKLAALKRLSGWKPKVSRNDVFLTRSSRRRIRMVFAWRGADPKIGQKLLRATKWAQLDKVAGLPEKVTKKKTWHLVAPPKTPAEAAKLLDGAFPKTAGKWKLVGKGSHIYGNSVAAMGYYRGNGKERMLFGLFVGVPRAQFDTAAQEFLDRIGLLPSGPRTYSFGEGRFFFERRPGRVRYYFELQHVLKPRNAKDPVLNSLNKRRIDAVLLAGWNRKESYPDIQPPKTPEDGARMLIRALPKQVAGWTLDHSASRITDGAVDVLGIYTREGKGAAIFGFGTGSRKSHRSFIWRAARAKSVVKGNGIPLEYVVSNLQRSDKKGAVLQSLSWTGVKEKTASQIFSGLNLTLLDAVQRAEWNKYGK